MVEEVTLDHYFQKLYIFLKYNFKETRRDICNDNNNTNNSNNGYDNL